MVSFFRGATMHTRKHEYGDSDIWRLPNDVNIDDDKLYCVEYDESFPSDPMDMSTFTTVYKLEEVPENILEAIEMVDKYTKIIKEYKRNFGK